MVTISIITITYNAEKFLTKTIESVLGQQNCKIEYILVDGNSKDRTVEIIKEYGQKVMQGLYPCIDAGHFRFISEPDKGLYDAMNKGMQMATGEFVWFINAGDKIYAPDTTEKIEALIKTQSKCDVVYGQSLMIDADDKPLGERHKIAPKKLLKRDMLHGLVVCHQSILVRKSIAPLYDLQYRVSADYDWTTKVLSVSRQNCYIDDFISRFMISGLSAVLRKKSWKERFHSMKNHFGLCRTLWAHFVIVMKYPFTKKY